MKYVEISKKNYWTAEMGRKEDNLEVEYFERTITGILKKSFYDFWFN